MSATPMMNRMTVRSVTTLVPIASLTTPRAIPPEGRQVARPRHPRAQDEAIGTLQRTSVLAKAGRKVTLLGHPWESRRAV
jgi:hypothetical protein